MSRSFVALTFALGLLGSALSHAQVVSEPSQNGFDIRADDADLPPEPIVGGSPAEPCAWAMAVGLGDAEGPFCSGTLIAPRVIVTAAHCVDEHAPWVADTVVFGHDGNEPVAKTGIETCVIHPDWDADEITNDLAVCILSEDAPPVPIVPLLAGCETEILEPGVEVTVVGFGWSDEALNWQAAGVKRHATHIVESIDPNHDTILALGTDGSSICFGDSGGSLFVQLRDGTWRLVGVTSEAVPPDRGPPYCVDGTMGKYELVHTRLAWLEAVTGIDLTPCHDSDGTWNPSAACGEFPLDPEAAGPDWKQCQVSQSGYGSLCGAPFVPEEPDEGDTGGDTGGEDAATGDTGPDETGAAAEESSSASQEETQGEGGCTCATSPDANGWWVLALVLLPIRRKVSRIRSGRFRPWTVGATLPDIMQRRRHRRSCTRVSMTSVYPSHPLSSVARRGASRPSCHPS